MKFGIFYELQLPRPWGPDDEFNLYQNALSQLELADRLGYDYAWEVEHHFLEEYSHSSAPEVFLAAVSQRTRHIRLGHGIVQTPPPTTTPPWSTRGSPSATPSIPTWRPSGRQGGRRGAVRPARRRGHAGPGARVPAPL